MAVDNSKGILQALARDLGYRSVKDMRDTLGKERAGRKDKDTGFLDAKKIGSGFGVGVKSRLESGKSIKKSLMGGYKDFRETLTTKNIKLRTLEKMFSGPGFISAFARPKLQKRYGISPTKKGSKGSKDGDDDNESNSLQSIISSSMALPGIAKDMNILRQNMVALAKIERKTEEQQDLSKQGDFFKSQDAEEAQLEAQRLKAKTPTVMKKSDDSDADGGGGGILDNIIGSLKDGLLGGMKSLFNPMALLKLLGKAFAIGALLFSLFEGITAGFKKWQETGNLGEAIIAGLGAMIEFLTFGLFGEDSIKKLIDSIGDVVEPIIDSIRGAYYSFKDWIANNVGIPKFEIPLIGKSIGPYYPFKKDSTSEAKQDSAGEYKAKRTEEKVQKEMQKATDVIAGVSKDLGLSPSKESTDGIVKKVSEGLEKATALGSGMPKDSKQRADILGQINSITASNLENIKKLNEKGDYSLGRAEDYEKNVVNPVKTQLANAQNKLNEGIKGGISGSMDKAAAAISDKISAGGPAENSLGGGASMMGGGSSGGGGGGSSGEGGSSGGGGASLAPIGSSMGADLASKSSQISEGQRMESAADTGSMINSPITNNKSGSMGSGSKSQVGDTYNMDLINLLART